jgi:hypothetical protein
MLDKDGLQMAIQAFDKRVEIIRNINKSYVPKDFGGLPYVIRDDLGIHGIQSQADGKYYDSKSEYRKSLKRQGYIEMGSDAPVERKSQIDGEFVSKREIAETISRLGG